MRLALTLPLIALVAACGSARVQPLGPAPKSARSGPPPAWIETSAGRTWLGFSSWCWRHGDTGGCVDALAPRCGQTGVPGIHVRKGETVRAHLGYTPTEASVGEAAKPAELSGRLVSWRFAQAGPFSLFTRGDRGDASYVGCARLD